MDRLVGKDNRTGLATLVGFEGVYDSLSAPNALAVENALTRLSAYEDTGLTPEELDNLCRQMSEIRTSLGFKTLNDVYELVNKERLVVLPCKVGDTVYAVLEDMDSYGSYIIEDEQISEAGSKGFWVSGISDEPDEMHIFTPWSDFGKTVFLTREEAEKALERSEKNDEP